MTTQEINERVEAIRTEARKHRPASVQYSGYDSSRVNLAMVPGVHGNVGNWQRIVFTDAPISYKLDALRNLVRAAYDQRCPDPAAEHVLERIQIAGVMLDEELHAPKEIRGTDSTHVSSEGK